MGQKVNPISFRLGVSKYWNSNWYAGKDYAKSLTQDILIRDYLFKNLKSAGVNSVQIDRAGEFLKINIWSARPGLIIGRKGEDADKLKVSLTKILKCEPVINVKELKRPEVRAQFIAQNVALQIEKRIAFRRAMKKAMQNALRFKVGGCKIMISGRLNGAEMARTEWIREGRVPLHTLKANIDYATCEAHTTYGIVGVKVWTFHQNQNNSTGVNKRNRNSNQIK